MSMLELGKWYKGKQIVLGEYKDQHKKLMSAIAGRGFLIAPGYMTEALTDLEQRSKIQLSDLNFEIVKEAIERELQQTEHAYGIAYKAARITFESNKATLLTNLEKEFADLKYVQAMTEEEINRKFIELQIRAIILITTKTSIGLQLEALKQELIETDRLTLINEVALAEAKLVTAYRKLEIIPYLEELILKQTELLLTKETLIPYLEDEIEAKEALANKEEEMLPYVEWKAVKLEEYATALLTEIVIEQERLEISLNRAILRIEEVDNDLDIIEANRAIEILRQDLLTANAVLSFLKVTGRINLTGDITTDINELAGYNTIIRAALDSYRVAISSEVLADRQEVIDITTLNDETTNIISVNSEKATIQKIAEYHGDEEIEKANLAAAANITAELVHILSS